MTDNTINMILTFGKYKGKSIKEVYNIDEGYCRWLYSQNVIVNKSPEVNDYIQKKFANTDTSYVLRFGKHKNKTFLWVSKNDPKYIDYLKTNDYVNDKCPKLVEELVHL